MNYTYENTINYTYEINFSTAGREENGMDISLKITNLDKVRVKAVAAMGIRGFRSYKIVNEQTGEIEESVYRGLEFSGNRSAVQVMNEIEEFINATIE